MKKLILVLLLVAMLAACKPSDDSSLYNEEPTSKNLPWTVDKFIDDDVVCYVYKRISADSGGGISCLPCWGAQGLLEACNQ